MPTKPHPQKKLLGAPPWLLPVLVVVLGVLVAAAMILVSWRRTDPLTQLELVLFQVLSMGLGLAGSYTFGRVLGSSPPNARSAFRRVLRLYEALGRFNATVDERRRELVERADGSETVALADVLDSLQMIEIQVTENLRTVDDAMEDWRDLAPAEVEQVEEKARAQERARGGDVDVDA